MATWQLDPQVIHLNHGSFGAAPIEVLEEQARLRSEMESNPVGFMLRSYQPLLEQARARLGAFVGVEPAGLVFVPNATYGINSVLRSLEEILDPGSDIVVTNHAYNACRNVIDETARRAGATVRTARIPFPITDEGAAVEAVLAAVTTTTSLVLLDHVTSTTGLVLPIKAIIDQLGPAVTVVIDGAHAPGMIDIDIDQLGADFYTGNCHKWICAPKGAGFLWVAERFRDSARAVAISHGYNDGWPASGTRFHAQFDWTGTDDPTARLCVPTALNVVPAHVGAGWEAVRDHNHELVLAGRILVAEVLGIEPPAPGEMIGSMASLPVPDQPGASTDVTDPLITALHERWSIEVPVFAGPSASQRLLRISAQLYNSLSDYERLAEALQAELGR